ncbi:hypothetical protein PL373_18870 [Tenacibaculum maritimum]|nr:hypothetical protein [Tenacibaculum maritimum]MDB0603151.1 hypothetical protein [Tenacibaculum maritimum]MDB0610415.1 hypothetical protein [Tenacibaculum maritimum]
MQQESPYEYHNNKLGIKIKFLISDKKKSDNSFCFIAYRSLKWRTDSKTCCEKELRKGSWSYDALIEFSTLSQDWKDAITTKFGSPKEEIKKSWFAQHYESDRKAFDFYVAHRYADDKKLEPSLIEKYTYNASVLNTVLEMKTNRKAYAKALGCSRIDIWDSLSKDVNAFRDVAHNLPTTKDSLRRKVSQYSKLGYSALVSGKLQNANAKKVTLKEQMALLDELIAKHTNLNNEQIASIYNTVARRMKWKTITSVTVANRKEKSNLITFAGRNGSKALSNKLLMQNKRKAPSSPMLYWTLDGWDAELLYQKTIVDKAGYTKTTYHNRLTVVAVLDPYNKYPIGYAIGTHETPKLIKKALQNAFNHTKELFGSYYKPYQLQSDNYSIKKLTPLYEACTKNFTPAKVGNSKSKVIEPYFDYLNEEYCHLKENWSGYNVNTGSKNQPNDEMLNKIRKSFPTEAECYKQIESIIADERSRKVVDFKAKWEDVATEYRQEMDLESYLFTFGSTTGYTNKLKGEGLVITIDGVKRYFDSFDVNFRKFALEDWTLKYDTNDLTNALAISSDGKHHFLLEEKYIQPMALADRKEGDALQLQKVADYNKNVVEYITNQREENYNTLEDLFETPALNDTLAKHLIIDSHGQHKNQRNQPRAIAAKAAVIETKAEEKIATKKAKTFREEQQAYYNDKIDINEYINQ